MRNREQTMPHAQFDSFGERIPNAQPHDVDQRRTSRRVLLAGTGIFWTLVVVILSARALYFDPDVASTFAQLADRSARSILSLLGG